MTSKLIIFDFNRTIFDPVENTEMEGFTDVLKHLKESGRKVCVVSKIEETNNKRLELLKNLKFLKPIDKIYFVKSSKLKAFQEAIADFKVSSEETCVIGDYLEKDIKPALELGCETVWFKNGEFSKLTPEITGIYPNYTIKHLSELMTII